ncbi:hypothetical protein [Synechococcus sp. PCC 7336]|uniref:hypothetical protein n=1 Tax=Synechococcus sp. PCC 7336 TaxID=195250 RepID=UPI0003457A24|nr:hypothetical protein [Synechococcus sp. PCC 7336]
MGQPFASGLPFAIPDGIPLTRTVYRAGNLKVLEEAIASICPAQFIASKRRSRL